MSFTDEIHKRRVSPDQASELKERTIHVNRVAKVVKGGRRFGFSALVVVGDAQGHVGMGLGKAGEVPDALRKAGEGAKKTLIRVPIRGTTLPHEIQGKYGPTTVLLKPAAPGTGVIAGSTVRAVLESAGVKDIYTKVYGSTNPYNVTRAVFNGLLRLREPERVAAVRGINLEQLEYRTF